MFTKSLSVIFYFVYIVGTVIVVGANICTDLLQQEIISWSFFLITYVIGRLFFNEGSREIWEPLPFSILMFFLINVWGVVIVKLLDIISDGFLSLKLENMSSLSFVSYFAIVVLAMKLAIMNIEFGEE